MALRRPVWSQAGSSGAAFWGVGESGRAPLKDWRGWLWRVLTVGWLWLGVMVVYENGKYIFALDVACTDTFCGCCWLILVVVCGYGVIRCVIRWFIGIRKLVKKSRREDVLNYINENER